MSKKTLILFTSIFAIFFLTAQSCSFAGVSTGLAADCTGTGDILCDGTEAYECELASYGSGFYVSRASESDVSVCGAEPAEEETDELEPTQEREAQEDRQMDMTRDSDGDGLTN